MKNNERTVAEFVVMACGTFLVGAVVGACVWLAYEAYPVAVRFVGGVAGCLLAGLAVFAAGWYTGIKAKEREDESARLADALRKQIKKG